jgi:hypothetical protein
VQDTRSHDDDEAPLERQTTGATYVATEATQRHGAQPTNPTTIDQAKKKTADSGAHFADAGSGSASDRQNLTQNGGRGICCLSVPHAAAGCRRSVRCGSGDGAACEEFFSCMSGVRGMNEHTNAHTRGTRWLGNRSHVTQHGTFAADAGRKGYGVWTGRFE